MIPAPEVPTIVKNIRSVEHLAMFFNRDASGFSRNVSEYHVVSRDRKWYWGTGEPYHTTFSIPLEKYIVIDAEEIFT